MSVIGQGMLPGIMWYEVCPKCKKKGFYKPKVDVGRNRKIIKYPKKCKFCNYKEAEDD